MLRVFFKVGRYIYFQLRYLKYFISFDSDNFQM